jgi:uncharacterized protein YqeY
VSLKDRVGEDMKAALRAKDQARLSAIRLLLAAMKQKEVDERIGLEDAHVLAIIDKMIKQRRESVSQYESAGRKDLADAEKFEIGVLSEYLPKQMSDSEIAQKDMGKVMGLLKPRLAGRADLGKVSAQVKARLSA